MTLSITTRGQGRDLVLIHGWAMHGGIFAPLVAALETHFRLHIVDLPGHGASREFTPGDLDPAACARAIAARTPPAIWLGWSLGGLVAMRGALDAPDHVQALVAVACSPRFVIAEDWPHAVPAQVFADFASALEQRFDAAIERFLALETLGSTHAQEELRALRVEVFARGAPLPAALHEGLAILDRSDLRASLAGLRMPSLWIAGRRDRLVAPAAMHWAAQQALLGRHLELPSGHAPFLGHAPAMAEAIRALATEVPT